MPHCTAGGLRYSSAAVKELRAQRAYYAATSRRLELDFFEAIHQAEALALGNPEGFARVFDDADLRVIVVRRFPYRLIYAFRSGIVVIVAIAHTAMRPRRVADRI